MKKNAGYYMLMIFTWPMKFFPLEFHYFFSEILFFLIYRVFRYRRKVAHNNLSLSFPEKDEKEIEKINREFFKRFTDIFIETLYFTHVNLEKESKRLVVKNFEIVDDLLEKGRNVIWVAGHFGNWEYVQLFRKKLISNRYFIYKQLNNKTFDQFYLRLRSRAAQPLEMKQTYRKLIDDKQNNRQFLAYFISDQRPLKEELKHWITFMNQDTPVMLGTEKIARKTNAAVVYAEIGRIKRGYHHIRFETIVEDPSTTKPYEITDRFFARLEESVRKSPEQYLWTHKRWKYKRGENL
jgi:KDO2-lipid IV(A) lauroyltransferase